MYTIHSKEEVSDQQFLFPHLFSGDTNTCPHTGEERELDSHWEMESQALHTLSASVTLCGSNLWVPDCPARTCGRASARAPWGGGGRAALPRGCLGAHWAQTHSALSCSSRNAGQREERG